ncbi:MAG: ABC transporter substrate-binding protein [Candidatus Eremiobacteraeota bacterium]|nr:ABC transporter substrate-binding protein [Candidatus Eremiobacteraeota bacterium]
MKKFIPYILILLVTITTATANENFPIKVKDCRGKTITIQVPPQKIISLAPSLTEILCSLGLFDSLAGVTTRCNYPPQVKSLPKIGDVFVDKEKLIALNPDLVVAEAILSSDMVVPLEKLGLKVLLLDSNNLAGFENTLLTLGKATGTYGKAKELLSGFKKTLSDYKNYSKNIPGEKHPRVLIEIQARPLFAAGEGTFMSDIVNLAGGKNIINRLPTGSGPVSLEKVISSDPQVIILTDTTTPEEFLSSPVWKNTSAARHRRVYSINPDIFVRPTLRLPLALKQLKEWFNIGPGEPKR